MSSPPSADQTSVNDRSSGGGSATGLGPRGDQVGHREVPQRLPPVDDRTALVVVVALSPAQVLVDVAEIEVDGGAFRREDHFFIGASKTTSISEEFIASAWTSARNASSTSLNASQACLGMPGWAGTVGHPRGPALLPGRTNVGAITSAAPSRGAL